jgi:hypothetical protein
MPIISVRHTTLLLLFCLSLAPISIETSSSGIYVNYFYGLVLVLPFAKYRQSQAAAMLILVYAIVFLAGFFDLLTSGWHYLTRTTLSFAVFILPLLISFVKIEPDDFKAFKKAVVILSVVYSAITIFQLVRIGYSGDFFRTKVEIGTNRYGFILILGFFIAMFEEGYSRMAKPVILTVLIVGIVLTFSRSSFVAFAVTIAYLTLSTVRKLKLSYLVNGTILALVMVFIFRETIIGEITVFFSEYLGSFGSYQLGSSATSEGYRVHVITEILNYVLRHPLFGSNFAGLYLAIEEFAGTGASAHGQYNDMLLRTGFVGLSVYLYVLYRMTRFYSSVDKGIFYGLLGILVYGLFHETFKLAHGSFLFAILLSNYLYQVSKQRTAKSIAAPAN